MSREFMAEPGIGTENYEPKGKLEIQGPVIPPGSGGGANFEQTQNNFSAARTAKEDPNNPDPDKDNKFLISKRERGNFFKQIVDSPIIQKAKARLDQLYKPISQLDPFSPEMDSAQDQLLKELNRDVESVVWQSTEAIGVDITAARQAVGGAGNAYYNEGIQRILKEISRKQRLPVADDSVDGEWSPENPRSQFEEARDIYLALKETDTSGYNQAQLDQYNQELTQSTDNLEALISQADQLDLFLEVHQQLGNFHQIVFEGTRGGINEQRNFDANDFEKQLWLAPKFRSLAPKYKGLGIFLYDQVRKSILKAAKIESLTNDQRQKFEVSRDPRYVLDQSGDIGDREYEKVHRQRERERWKEIKWGKPRGLYLEFDWARNEEELIASMWEWLIYMEGEIRAEDAQEVKADLDQKSAETQRMLAEAKIRLGLADNNPSYLYCKSLAESCEDLRGCELVNKGGFDYFIYYVKKFNANFHHEAINHYDVTTLDPDVAIMLARMSGQYKAYYRGGEVMDHVEGRQEVGEGREYRREIENEILTEVEGLQLKLTGLTGQQFEIAKAELLENHPVFVETRRRRDQEDGLLGLTGEAWESRVDTLIRERVVYWVKQGFLPQDSLNNITGTSAEQRTKLRKIVEDWNNSHAEGRDVWFPRKWDYVAKRITKPEQLLHRALPEEAYLPPINPDGSQNPYSLYEPIQFKGDWTQEDITQAKSRRRKELQYKFLIARRTMLKDLMASWYGGTRLIMKPEDVAQAKTQGRYSEATKPFFIEFQERLAAIPEGKVSWPERVANNDVRDHELDQIRYKLKAMVLMKKIPEQVQSQINSGSAQEQKNKLIKWMNEWNAAQLEEERFYPGDAPMRDQLRKIGMAHDLPMWTLHLASSDDVRKSISRRIGFHSSQNHDMAHMFELERRMMRLIEEQIMEEWQRGEMINHFGGNVDLRRILDMARMTTTGSIANDLIVAMTPALYPFLWEMGCKDYREFTGLIKRRDEWEAKEESLLDVLDPKEYVERVEAGENGRKLSSGGSVGDKRVDGILNGGPLAGGYRMAGAFRTILKEDSFDLFGKLKKGINLTRLQRNELLELSFKILEPTIGWMKNRKSVENRYGKVPKSWEWENTLAWLRIQRWMFRSPKFSDEAPQGFAYAEEARSDLAIEYYDTAFKEDHLILHGWPQIKLPKEVMVMRRPESTSWRKRAEAMPTFLPNLTMNG